MQRTGKSKSTIYLNIQQGDFPSPIPIGAHSVAWIEREVDTWIEERIKRALASRDQNKLHDSTAE